MGKFTVNIKVKEAFVFKLFKKLVIALIWCRIISYNFAVRLINWSIRNGAFKHKINDGKWLKLDNMQIEN